MAKVMIKLGSFGELGVDTAAFNEQVREYIFNYGLKQMLNDAHASVTAKTNPKDLAEAKIALARKKLDSLLAGNVAQSRGGGSDPVQKELVAMATKHVKDVLKRAGKKWADYGTEVQETLLAKALEKNMDTWRPLAERIVSDRKLGASAAMEDVDILDLI